MKRLWEWFKDHVLPDFSAFAKDLQLWIFKKIKLKG